jgi:hypothetical protein
VPPNAILKCTHTRSLNPSLKLAPSLRGRGRGGGGFSLSYTPTKGTHLSVEICINLGRERRRTITLELQMCENGERNEQERDCCPLKTLRSCSWPLTARSELNRKFWFGQEKFRAKPLGLHAHQVKFWFGQEKFPDEHAWLGHNQWLLFPPF